MTMELGLAPNAASVLTSHPRIAGFFEDAAKLYRDPVKVANYIQSEVMRDVMTTGLDATFPVTPGQLADLLRLVDEGVISGKQAKEVYAAMVGTTDTAEAIVRARGMRVVSDEGELEAVARRVLADNEKQLSAYRAGKLALFGYFVGQVMKATRGSADPKGVNEVLAGIAMGNVVKGAPAVTLKNEKPVPDGTRNALQPCAPLPRSRRPHSSAPWSFREREHGVRMRRFRYGLTSPHGRATISITPPRSGRRCSRRRHPRPWRLPRVSNAATDARTDGPRC